MSTPVKDLDMFAAARAMMVDSQVRPNKVTDSRVVDAMRRLPRERFVPTHLAALAYSDEDVPLGDGRFLMEPMLIARLIQAASVQPGETVLVVGSGAGYGAAVLAWCGARVTALEEDRDLIARARATLPSVTALGAPAIAMVEGPLREGWKPAAPYDVVLIEGGVEDVPASLAAQVNAIGGRLLAIRNAPGRVGTAVIGEHMSPEPSAALSFQTLFDCATPTLPGMRRVAGFVF